MRFILNFAITLLYPWDSVLGINFPALNLYDTLPPPPVTDHQYDATLVRTLQQLPVNYTSPPTALAIAATPQAFQTDEAVDTARQYDAGKQCPSLDPSACNILFPPPVPAVESGTVKLGVLFYGGALVDPRGYSPIMKDISERYGLPVVLPIFDKDLAFVFGTCNTGRLDMAAKAFPYVEKWVLAGHSFGGIAAGADLWSLSSQGKAVESIAGLALIASYVRQDVGCGPIDFSNTTMPTAAVTASLDGVLNYTYWQSSKKFLPVNDTFFLDIQGGNHGQFGSYDDSARTTLLHQADGKPLIPAAVQHSLEADAMVQVASRAGLPLPSWNKTSQETTDPVTSGADKGIPTSLSWNLMSALVVLYYLFY